MKPSPKCPVSHLTAAQAARYMLEVRGIRISSQSIALAMYEDPPRVPSIRVFGPSMIPVKFLRTWMPRSARGANG